MLNLLTDVFKSFQKHDVKYVIIGGIASILYGVPRATFDLDILIETKTDNARRLLNALHEAGFGTASMTTEQDILANDVTIFNDKVRIDVQTHTPGLNFNDAWNRKNAMNHKGANFYILSKEDLILSKKACGREKDLEDVRCLEISISMENY